MNEHSRNARNGKPRKQRERGNSGKMPWRVSKLSRCRPIEGGGLGNDLGGASFRSGRSDMEKRYLQAMPRFVGRMPDQCLFSSCYNIVMGNDYFSLRHPGEIRGAEPGATVADHLQAPALSRQHGWTGFSIAILSAYRSGSSKDSGSRRSQFVIGL